MAKQRTGISTGKKVAALAAGAAAAVAGVVATRAWKRGPLVLHVVPNGDGWKLTGESRNGHGPAFETKDEAIAAGRDRARSRVPSQLVIHRTDGTIQTRHSYEVRPGAGRTPRL